LLKDLGKLRETKSRGAIRFFAQDVTAVLWVALTLRDQKPSLTARQFRIRASRLERQLDQLLDPRRKLTDPDNWRLAQHLHKQCAHLFRFLYIEGLDATNNQAAHAPPSGHYAEDHRLQPRGARRFRTFDLGQRLGDLSPTRCIPTGRIGQTPTHINLGTLGLLPPPAS
jgi:hypothetical protein